jgi:hypothetical protein
VREASEVYGRFHHADGIAMAEGYHAHQYSPENQEAALAFLDHFNGVQPPKKAFAAKELDDKTVQCTRTGQVMLDFEDARSMMDVIRDYYEGRKKQPAKTIKQLYHSDLHPHIDTWKVSEFHGEVPGDAEIAWGKVSDSQFEGVTIEKYLLRHGRYLQMPLLHIHKTGSEGGPVLLWLAENGKATAEDWPSVAKYVADGYGVLSFDPRGLGETRMPYKAASPDDPSLAQLDLAQAYVNPLSGVLSDYVYNSLLVGRPYLFQMIEDVEIAARFSRTAIHSNSQFFVAGSEAAAPLVSTIAETLPDMKLLPHANSQPFRWSEVVEQKTELWPIQFLLPGGAYIH